MPIPDAENAIVTRNKVDGYLLNLDHPDGGSKAIWFQSLGYERENWQLLANDLLEIARICNKYDMERSPHVSSWCKIQGVGHCQPTGASPWLRFDRLDCRVR